MMNFAVEMKILITKHIDANALMNIFIIPQVKIEAIQKVRITVLKC
jgi:hypothetical protein